MSEANTDHSTAISNLTYWRRLKEDSLAKMQKSRDELQGKLAELSHDIDLLSNDIASMSRSIEALGGIPDK